MMNSNDNETPVEQGLHEYLDLETFGQEISLPIMREMVALADKEKPRSNLTRTHIKNWNSRA